MIPQYNPVQREEMRNLATMIDILLAPLMVEDDAPTA
jgi:hypothetical protein